MEIKFDHRYSSGGYKQTQEHINKYAGTALKYTVSPLGKDPTVLYLLVYAVWNTIFNPKSYHPRDSVVPRYNKYPHILHWCKF